MTGRYLGKNRSSVMSKKTNTAVSQNESKTVYQKPQIRQ